MPTSTSDNDFVVVLQVHYFQKPQSVEVLLRKGPHDSEATMHVIRHSKEQLLVEGEQERKLPQDQTAALTSKLLTDEFLQAASRAAPREDGLRRGDRFVLRWVRGTKQPLTAAGFLEDAPAAVRVVIDGLLTSARDAADKALSPAYLVSSTVSAARADKIIRAGKVRIVSLGELPPDLQTSVNGFARRPDVFLSLPRDLANRLLQWKAYGQEIFVKDERNLYQLTIFWPRDQKPGDQK